MTQSRRASFIESCANTCSAAILSFVIAWAIYAALDGLASGWIALTTTIVLTAVSIGRNYIIRRIFEGRNNRVNRKEQR
jgi:membrane protein required for beta-lactamase induction